MTLAQHRPGAQGPLPPGTPSPRRPFPQGPLPPFRAVPARQTRAPLWRRSRLACARLCKPARPPLGSAVAEARDARRAPAPAPLAPARASTDATCALPAPHRRPAGSRLLVSVDERGGEAEPARGDRPKRPRDGAPGHHKGSGEERGRERREHGQEDRHKRHRPPDERGRPRDAQRRENARGRDGRPRGPR